MGFLIGIYCVAIARVFNISLQPPFKGKNPLNSWREG